MAYILRPSNKLVGDFEFGAFSFPVLLEACGYLFSSIHSGGSFYCVWGADKRMGDQYPLILTNDGFKVTAEEARILGRIAQNLVTIQRSLPDENKTKDMRSESTFDRKSVLEMMMNAMQGNTDAPWPVKIRTDFVDKFEKFAIWSPQSRGFSIR